MDWVEATLGRSVEVVQHWWTGVRTVRAFPGQEPPEIPAGFPLLTWRWIGERTFAWRGRSRRPSTDDEYLPATGEAWISAGRSRLIARRLAKAPT